MHTSRVLDIDLNNVASFQAHMSPVPHLAQPQGLALTTALNQEAHY